MNRVYRQLVAEGVITKARQHIVINDPARLEALAMRPRRTKMAQMALTDPDMDRVREPG